MSWFINDSCGLGLDVTRIIKYALIHDLVETYAGDTPAFPNPLMDIDEWSRQKATKKEREAKSLARIVEEWDDLFPEMLALIHAYEERVDEESKFVYSTDKLISIINVFLDGGSSWKKLEVTLEEMVTYKGPRAQEHPTVGGLYKELVTILKDNQHLFHQPT